MIVRIALVAMLILAACSNRDPSGAVPLPPFPDVPPSDPLAGPATIRSLNSRPLTAPTAQPTEKP